MCEVVHGEEEEGKRDERRRKTLLPGIIGWMRAGGSFYLGIFRETTGRAA